jgi:uncharacterized protein with HEPN domain
MSDDLAWLRDMLAAAAEASQLAAGCDFAGFQASREKQLALMHLLVIVGEAAAQVSEQTRLQLPAVPWRQVVGMRNRLVHHYFKAKIELVWDVVDQHVPALIAAVEPFLAQHPP